MMDLISDFNSMEGNSESSSVKCNSDSNSNSNDGNSNSIPIPPGLGQANSIPELDLELARNSNSGAELTPALVHFVKKSEHMRYGTPKMASRTLHLWRHGHYSFVHFPIQ